MLAPPVAACESCTHWAVIETRPRQTHPITAPSEQFWAGYLAKDLRPTCAYWGRYEITQTVRYGMIRE